MIPLALFPQPLPQHLDRQHIASLELIGAAKLVALALEGAMHVARDRLVQRACASNYLGNLLAGLDEHGVASVRNAMASVIGETRAEAEIDLARPKTPEEVFRGL